MKRLLYILCLLSLLQVETVNGQNIYYYIFGMGGSIPYNGGATNGHFELEYGVHYMNPPSAGDIESDI